MARRPLRLLPSYLLLLTPVAIAPAARAAESAVIQEILDGNQLYVDSRQAKVKQKATAPQQVSTENARGQLGFAGGAVGRINRFSRMRLGQGCFLLDRGQVLVSGRQSGCTRSARLSVRGTNFVLEVDDTGASQLSVLEGEVAVEPLKDGEPTGKPPTTVQAGQRLRLSPEGVILALLGLTSGDYTDILQGPLFVGFRLPLPNYGALESYIRAKVPGVALPSLPAVPTPVVPTPALPRFSVPRLF
ncbi:FecR domain-containing protein [Cyanobium sp. FGCU-6]|nr:FecR domain-containing protein [Cyanobium sp. FGCU6]